MLTHHTVIDLLDAFASPDPTPGGGSAAALAGALGASLLAMVAGMPKAKTTEAEPRALLETARTRLLAARARLIELIDRDSAAYDGVVAAYREPKGTEAEKATRKVAIQQALRLATEVPLETATLCSGALRDGATVEAYGNPNASSDVGTGLALLRAALHGALLNVDVNLGSLTDASLVEAIRRQKAAL
jgi:formiminotetrahydrofolate cyclodeaminase